MRKRNYLILLLLLFSLCVYAQSGWKDYDFSNHNFKIKFYEEPELSVDSTLANGFYITSYQWKVNIRDTSHANVHYIVAVTTLNPSVIHSDSSLNLVEDLLNEAQRPVFNNSDYVLLHSYLLEKNGFPGKVYSWKRKEYNMFMEFHSYLVENRLYEFGVITKPNKNHNVHINYFLNSFELVNVSKGKFTKPTIDKNTKLVARFPQKPEERVEMIDSKYGKLLSNMHILETKTDDSNLAYITYEAKFPPNAVNQDDIQELNSFYKTFIEGSLNTSNGELVSIKDIHYKEKLGKEFRSSLFQGSMLMIVRLFFIDNALYSIGVLTTSDKDNNKQMEDFFNSFSIQE